MKHCYLPLLAILITANLSAQNYIVSASLSGANEVPPNASAGTGTLTGTYNSTTNELILDITYANLGSNLS